MTSMKHDKVVNDFQAMLDQSEPPMTSDCCIYRVPFNIHRLNEDAYTPTVVSIGPLHHHHPHLQNMERHKLIFFKSFLQRAEASLDRLIRYIEEVEPEFRSCYSDTLDLSEEKLVKMILIDSGFIIELFWRCYYLEWLDDETFFTNPKMTRDIKVDLFLHENQVPFFVLDDLFNLSFRSGSNPSFLRLTFAYFSAFNITNLAYDNVSIRHFTDLIRMFHLQHPVPPRIRIESMVDLPSATELLEAGVRFKVNTESHCLLDLRFSGSILEIPQLEIVDRIEILYRNLLALEQCLYPRESYITDYIVILDFLINTSRDVDTMVRKKILINWLGNNDSVAKLFNSLVTNITLSKFNSHYFQICKDLNAFCTDPWHELKPTLMHDYCKTPWQTVVSIAGIVLLILSLIQSVCSILQVVQQCKVP